MKKILKVVLVLVLVLVGGLAAVAIYVKTALPDVGDAPEIKVEVTPERIAKGEYLATSVMACMDCHSQRDWSIYGAPVIEGTWGAGGEKFSREMQFPGTLYSRNITPHGLSSWTDGEIFRAITSGQNKSGEALFPLMGYLSYGKMDREDVYSIIAYLRSLPAIKSDIPERELDFPVNFLVNTFPEQPKLSTKPPKTDVAAYGGYLVTIANCVECHSKFDDKGTMFEGSEFGGGRTFFFPNGNIVTAPNISPDEETGIGNWTKEAFIQKFKSYSDSSYKMQKLGKDDYNTPMPWLMYTNLDSADLGAMYTYLRTVKKQKNMVNRFSKSK